MQTKGFDSFIKKLEVDIDKKTGNVLKKTGVYILKDVQMNTPVDTGRLRRSWKITRDLNKVTISNNTKYARHVEYGHRTRASAKNVRYNSKTRTFHNKISVVPGRHMLRNSVERGKILLVKEMAEIKLFGGD